MEPRNYEKPLESGNDKENLALPTKETKRRFQIVRLEERAAPTTTGYGIYGANTGLCHGCFPLTS
jgi:hypothetical protein